MRKNIIKSILALVVVALVGGLSLTEKGRELSETVLGSLSASAAGAERYELQVVIATRDKRNYEYTESLTDRQFRDLRNRPERVRDDYVLKAKKEMAEKFGYGERRYGKEHYKMLTGPQLMAFKLVDNNTHRVQHLFRDELRQGAFNSIFAE